MVEFFWSVLNSRHLLTQAAITGASLTAVIMYARRHHPKQPRRNVIDVDVMLLLLPAMLVGVMFGVIFRTACPRWFVFTLLIVIVLWGSVKTITKVCFTADDILCFYLSVNAHICFVL
jgi:uncharacterized membrane protein YfcA